MSSARTREARQVSDAYHLALAYLGYSVMEEAWREWRTVDLSRPRTTSAAWADAVLAAVRTARETARTLARLYYRLLRALHTGSTVPAPPGTEVREKETLGDLRREFRLAVEEVIPVQRTRPSNPQTKKLWDRAGLGEPLPELPSGGFDEEVEVDDDFDWGDDSEDDYVEDVLGRHMDNLVSDLERKRLERERDRERKAEDEKAWAEDRREKVGGTQAGASQLSVLGAARHELYLAGGRDARVIGYIRVSKTGDPCHFCAMLISRGLVLYGSERTAATRESDGEDYHPGCNCVAEPVFSKAQYQSDEKFALNRELEDLWKKEIRNKYSGKDAINAWRRLLRRRRASARKESPTPADAQAA